MRAVLITVLTGLIALSQATTEIPYISGGVRLKGKPRKYGKFRARVKIDNAPGSIFNFILTSSGGKSGIDPHS